MYSRLDTEYPLPNSSFKANLKRKMVSLLLVFHYHFAYLKIGEDHGLVDIAYDGKLRAGDYVFNALKKRERFVVLHYFIIGDPNYERIAAYLNMALLTLRAIQCSRTFV